MMPGRSRRQFVLGAAALGVGAAGFALLEGCGRLPWQAPPVKIPKIGVLSLGAPGVTTSVIVAEALRQGLGERGYVEGHNLIIEWRFAEGRPERLPALAVELAQLGVDVIVTA